MRTLFIICLTLIHSLSFAITATEQRINANLQHLTTTQLIKKLQAMPKGADLHNHLGGAAYAEGLLKDASAGNYCINTLTLSAYAGDCANKNRLNFYAADAELRDSLIDAWSMRHFISSNPKSGHDHFFATFGKTSLLSNTYLANVLADLMQHAEDQHISYLELMVTIDKDASGRLGRQLGMQKDWQSLQAKLMANGLPAIVNAMSDTLDTLEQQAKQIHPAVTKVKVAYLYQVLREQPPEMVFAQLLAGYLAAQHDARIVGINMVQPEDGKISLRDYHLHMQMIAYLHQQFPQVKVSLHAGEMTSTFAAAGDLTFHINDAVNTAKALRIGHGVDIYSEANRRLLLTYMAQHHILVEINLTSNQQILNISGAQHPYALYQQYNVPLALSTDDEGVTRSSLTQEYAKAMREQHASYSELKMLARNSLQYAFLSGKSYWQDYSTLQPVTACRDMLEAPACQAYLASNAKAALQAQLEADFISFEKGFV